MNEQLQETQRVVQNLNELSSGYWRQIHVWLGVASGGAILSVTGVVSALPDIDHAFKFFAPSYLMFLTGMVFAGVAVICAANKASTLGDHYAAASNRDELKSAISSIPEVFASPKSLADRSNIQRNSLIAANGVQHERSEQAWREFRFWNIAWVASLLVSLSGFVFGFAWPVVSILWWGGTLTSL